MAKVLFFGFTGDITGTKEKNYSAGSIAELKELVFLDYPALRESKFRIAVNGVIYSGEKEIKGDEIVALLPPFAGG